MLDKTDNSLFFSDHNTTVKNDVVDSLVLIIHMDVEQVDGLILPRRHEWHKSIPPLRSQVDDLPKVSCSSLTRCGPTNNATQSFTDLFPLIPRCSRCISQRVGQRGILVLSVSQRNQSSSFALLAGYANRNLRMTTGRLLPCRCVEIEDLS